jgi:hypothetical protein
MRTRSITVFATGILMLVLTLQSPAADAQGVEGDPIARLSTVLPADVARHVLAVIDEARAEHLPADALANRSLKFAARGIAPQQIARAVDEQLVRMRSVRDALRTSRNASPRVDEIEAGAEALRQGVKPPDLATLAREAPSGRSLTVPLYVMGSLVNQGVSSDKALLRVQKQLLARSSDADIEASAGDNAAAGRAAPGEEHGHGGEESGRGNGAGSSGANSHGPPAGVPGNSGAHGKGKGQHGPPNGKGHP